MERLRQLAAHRGRYVLIALAALKRRCELQKMSGEEVIPTMMKILRLENASVSTPQQRCIGGPEQKCISEREQKAP